MSCSDGSNGWQDCQVAKDVHWLLNNEGKKVQRAILLR